LAPFANDEKQSHLNSSQIPLVLKLNGGGSNESSELGPKMASKQDQVRTSNKREMLKKHFPDWERRINYQNQQLEFWQSGRRKIRDGKRAKLNEKQILQLFTRQEKDAFDYFNGTGFYNYHQDVKTPPNIFDTRSSFLLKVEKNREMREKFLKYYNRRKGAN
jgi:hypothetical protein